MTRRRLNPKLWAGLNGAATPKAPGAGRGRPGQRRPSIIHETAPCSRPGCDGVVEIRAKRSTPWPTCSPACRLVVWRDLRGGQSPRPTEEGEDTVVEQLLPGVDVAAAGDEEQEDLLLVVKEDGAEVPDLSSEEEREAHRTGLEPKCLLKG